MGINIHQNIHQNYLVTLKNCPLKKVVFSKYFATKAQLSAILENFYFRKDFRVTRYGEFCSKITAALLSEKTSLSYTPSKLVHHSTRRAGVKD